MQRDGGPGGGPGGAGGAGNPVGGGFTGAAQALEIYGDFAAAYSGLFDSTNTLDDYLNFTTGAYLFVGELTVIGGIKNTDANLSSGNFSAFRLSFNGQEVLYHKVDTTQEGQPSAETINIIIPPYTEVTVKCVTSTNDATLQQSCEIMGRVYRG